MTLYRGGATLGGREAGQRSGRAAVTCERVDRRGGGVTLVVRKPVDRMSPAEVRETLAILANRTRLGAP